jgi:hypothetical protein
LFSWLACSLVFTGAQVILTKTINVAKKLVNGARGEVVGFSRAPRLPEVQFKQCTVVVDLTDFTVVKQPGGQVKIHPERVGKKINYTRDECRKRMSVGASC